MCPNSRDILNLTLSLSVALLTILMAWILIYVIFIFKSISQTIERLKTLVSEGEQILASFKERVKEIGTALPLFVTAIEKLITFVGARKRQKKSSGKPGAVSSKS